MSLSPARSSVRKKMSGYSSLSSNWGQVSRRIPKKKIILGWALLLLSFIFLIGNYSPEVSASSYNNTFSHTRTPIFSHTSSLAPNTGISLVTSNKATPVICFTSPISFPPFSDNGNDVIVVVLYRIGAGPVDSVTDTQGNAFTQRVSAVSGSGSGTTSFMYTATVTSGGPDTVSWAFSSGCWEGSLGLYRGVTSIGTSGTDKSDTAGSSGTSNITLTVASNSAVIESFLIDDLGRGTAGTVFTITPNSGQTVRQTNSSSDNGRDFETWKMMDKIGLASGSQTFSISFSVSPVGSPNSFSHLTLELQTSGSPSNPDTSLVRWNFNSTCVKFNQNFADDIEFFYNIGTTGSGGNNCNSADITLTKAPITLQTVSGRMMETILTWGDVAAILNNGLLKTSLFLRVNGTLPSFTENYDPRNDSSVRFIWEQTPTTRIANGLSVIYILKDHTKSLTQETTANDLIINGTAPAYSAGNSPTFQSVLNFTGPSNFLLEVLPPGASSTTSVASASGLQLGLDYFIGLKVYFDTTKSPGSCGCSMAFRSGVVAQESSANLPKTFQIFSVPASCSDIINDSTCTKPTNIFQGFNPLDPSTWGNMLAKMMVWVFLTAIPGGLLIFVKTALAVLEVTANFVGGLFGWGTLGTQLVSFLNSVGSLFLQLGTVALWIPQIIGRGVDFIVALNLYLTTQFTFLRDLQTGLFNTIGFLVTIGGSIVFTGPIAYIMIDLIFFFIFTASEGLGGFGVWLRWNQWVGFFLLNIAERILNTFISLIAWLIGRAPTMSGIKLPRLPLVHPGPVPVFKLDLGFPAIRSGDVTSVFLMAGGFLATILWAASTTGPFAGAPFNGIGKLPTNIQTMFLPVFGMVFLIMLTTLPLSLLRRVSTFGELKGT